MKKNVHKLLRSALSVMLVAGMLISTMSSALAVTAGEVIDAVTNSGNQQVAVEKVTNIVKELYSLIKEYSPKALEYVKNNSTDNVGSAADRVYNYLSDKTAAKVEQLKDAINEYGKEAPVWGAAFIALNYKNILSTYSSLLVEYGDDAYSFLENNVEALCELSLCVVKDYGENVYDFVASYRSAVVKMFKSVITNRDKIYAEAYELVYTAMTGAFDAVQNGTIGMDTVTNVAGSFLSTPSTPAEIVEAVYALADGETSEDAYTLTGVITEIDSPYSSSYNNISVVMVVEGCEEYPLLCWRMSGEGAADLVVGDTITVTGNVKNYGGTIEFVYPSLDSVEKTGGAVVIPTEPTEIVDAAYALEEGASLPYEATLTGVITEIKTEYSADYGNITVLIEVEGREGYPIECFRLKDGSVAGCADLAVGDTITVTGTIKNYYGTIEYAYPTLEGVEKAPVVGSALCPDVMMGTSATFTVPAFGTYYITSYGFGVYNLTVEGEGSFTVECGEVAESVDGVAAIEGVSGGRMGMTIVITNHGETDATYTVSLVEPLGAQGNPEMLEVDSDFGAWVSVSLGENDEDGYSYKWISTVTGYIAVDAYGYDADWNEVLCDAAVYNLNTYVQNTIWNYTLDWSEEFCSSPAVIWVNEGDEVLITVTTKMDENWNRPAADVNLSVSLPLGNEESPIMIGEHNMVWVPGETVTTYGSYAFDGNLVTIKGDLADLDVINNGVIYTDEDGDGVISFVAVGSSSGFWMTPTTIHFNNAGVNPATYELSVSYPVGTYENPEAIELDTAYSADFVYGDGDYHYVWTATEDGAFTVQVEGSNWFYYVMNETTYASSDWHYWDDAEPVTSETIGVSAGDVILIAVNTWDPAVWGNGDGTVTITATFAAGVHVHAYTVTDMVWSTCSTDGYTTFECSCGDTYTEIELAYGHYSWDEPTSVIAPTCTEDGYTTYICAECGVEFVDEWSIVPAYGHDYMTYVTGATCTEPGYTTYECHCGDTYVADETEPTGHRHEAVVTDPTCTEDGYTTYTCACGDTYVADVTEATGHNYGEPVVEGNVATATCTVCGDTVVEEIPEELPEEIPEDVEIPEEVKGYTFQELIDYAEKNMGITLTKSQKELAQETFNQYADENGVITDEKMDEILADNGYTKEEIENMSESERNQIVKETVAKEVATNIAKDYVENFTANIYNYAVKTVKTVWNLANEYGDEAWDLVELYAETFNEVLEGTQTWYDATHGNLPCYNDNYVALGGTTASGSTLDRNANASIYAEIVADELGVTLTDLTEAGMSAGELLAALGTEEYISAIQQATMVTVQLDVTDMLALVLDVISGEVELDWTTFFSEENVELVADLKADVAAYIKNHVGAILPENVGAVETLVEAVVYAVADAILNTHTALETIQEINPEAVVVVLGLYTGMDEKTVEVGGKTIPVGTLIEYAMESTDLCFALYSVFNENVVFVELPKVDTERFENLGGLKDVASLEELAIWWLDSNYEEALYANAAGHVYIAEQIVHALTCDGHNYSFMGFCRVCGEHYCEGGEDCILNVLGYTDVDTNAWYHDYVHSMVELGLMVGTSADPLEFSPSGTVTRAEVVKVLWNVAGQPAPTVTLAETGYTDVKADFWYTDAILWAYENGVAVGDGQGNFMPSEQVTREQIAQMIFMFTSEILNKDTSVKEDIDTIVLAEYNDGDEISFWAVDAMQWAVENGVISGRIASAAAKEVYLAPTSTAMRSELASMFCRFCWASGWTPAV